MHSEFIKIKNSQIHYLSFGKGPELLLCFHGYGEQAKTFRIFESFLGEKYTLWAIELPFHGKTEWNEDLHLNPSEFFNALLARIKRNGNKEVSLMGYSMGCRIAFSFIEYAPEVISSSLLMAPDGLRVNFWYWLATQSRPGNMIFKTAMKNPGILQQGLKMVYQLKIIDSSFYKFNTHFLSEEKIREDLYKIWTTMRDFKPDIEKVKKNIVSNNIRMTLVFGEYDRIIPAAQGKSFIKGIEPQVQIKKIPAGHQFINAKFAGQLSSFL